MLADAHILLLKYGKGASLVQFPVQLEPEVGVHIAQDDVGLRSVEVARCAVHVAEDVRGSGRYSLDFARMTVRIQL
jgi:hypothetical protein